MKENNISIAGIITEDGNSEKFNTGAWKAKRPIHFKEKCKNCMLCVPACPDNAIVNNDENIMCGFDYSKCKGCGVCAAVCPFKAIEMDKDNTESEV